MDKRNYDARIISRFNIIGCYFVDVLYNHVYISVYNRHITKSSRRSMTDDYKDAVIAYITGIKKNRDYYSKCVTGLHEYFRKTTKYSTIRLDQFIDQLLEQFLPEEYFSQLVYKDKEFFLTKIITDIVVEFGTSILNVDKLHMIIDDHKNEDNIKIWIDTIVTIQIAVRETLFNKFAKKLVGASESIPAETMDRITETLSSAIKEKCALEVKVKKAEGIISKLYEITKSLKTEKEQLEQHVNTLQNALQTARTELADVKTRKITEITPSNYTPMPAIKTVVEKSVESFIEDDDESSEDESDNDTQKTIENNNTQKIIERNRLKRKQQEEQRNERNNEQRNDRGQRNERNIEQTNEDSENSDEQVGTIDSFLND